MPEAKPIGRPRHPAIKQEAFKEKVIAIAQSLFFEEGFESVSMRKIAKMAGCSPMAIYYYFENKYEILRHIWEAIFEDLHRRCQTAVKRARSPLDALRRLSSAYLNYWLDHPEYFHLVYMQADPKTISMGDTVFNVEGSVIKDIYELFRQTIQRCIDAGQLRAGDAELRVQVLVSSMFGALLALLTVPEYPWKPKKKLTKEIIDNFIRGYSA